MIRSCIATALIVLAATPAAAQEQGPTVIAFAADRDTLTSAARAKLDKLAARLAGSDVQVTVSGHAAPAEQKKQASAQVGLSQRRAMNVVAYLVARGVPAGRVSTLAFGAARPDSSDPKIVRRVEITLGPSSGW